MKKLQILFLVIFLNININLLSAEWNKSIGLSTYYNENPYHYTGSIPLTFNNTNLNIEYAPENSKFQYYFSGKFSVIPQMIYSLLSDNVLSSSYFSAFGDDLQNNYIFTANTGMKLNSGDFNIYNNYQIGMSAALNYSLSETSFIKTGYKGIYKNYYNNIDLSYSEHIIYFGYKTYFETETSLITEIDYRYKNLSGDIISFGGKGSGKSNTQNLGQVIANLKIAQSIAEKTGISLMYSQSWSTGSDYKNMLEFNPNVIFEKEIYDDNYSFESQELTLTLTQYFSSDIKFQVYSYYFTKNYQYSFDFSIDKSVDNRHDVNSGFGFNAEKNINSSFLVFDNTKISLNYLFNKNSSNSEYFNYHNSEISLGIKLGF